jgi:hypothetical protein
MFIALCAAQTTLAQTTVFGYPGKLDFDGVPANGQFDFQFKLFDALTGGAQQGATLEQLSVDVTNGDYKVSLDFGAAVFPGADRFLEISFRLTGSSTYSILTPRQQITSTPYSIRSLVSTTADGLSATCSNCVTSNQILSVQGSQVAGSIAGSQVNGVIPVASVPAGSPNYIQNTTSPQPAANFNILGNGTAAGVLSGNFVNATTQYNLGGVRFLSNGGRSSNLFVGISAGASNAAADTKSSFFGSNAGQSNTTGDANSFFGYFSGKNNTTGRDNSFFGSGAGNSNTTSGENSFFGHSAGALNTGGNNSFFGSLAGILNTTGGDNSFFGFAAGNNNMTGSFNSFFGDTAGINNTTGSHNTFVGYNADFDIMSPTGDNNTLLGFNTKVKSGVSNSTAIGTGASSTTSNTVVLGTDQEVVIVPGKLEVDTLGVAGNQQLCLNKQNRLAPCSSSLRYKTDLRPFLEGMSIINRLQPVSFTWKDGGLRDLGFGAEDVEKIEPLLVTYNTQGLVEGVKYDRITVALVNALKQQQALIKLQHSRFEQQQTQLEQQRNQIELMKKLICREHPGAGLCR